MSNSKSRGFLNHTRETAAERQITDRLHDWQPLHLHLSQGKLQEQALRCMDCGIPFCHEGQVLNGMTTGCPVNNLIPEWNDLVYRGLWKQAYERLHRTNNFPEFTGQVCPAPCEAGCTLGITDPPVTIKSLEYAIIDKAFQEGWVTPDLPVRRTNKRVAVIGSGPAGLACASQLNLVGHYVTVFERADRIGGLLTYGIPNMKLDKFIVDRRVNLMCEAGIEFVTGKEVGKDLPVAELQEQFDAIVLCTGATRPRELPIPGHDLQGIHFAMEFLTANTKSLLDSDLKDGRYISAKDKDVIIIGGGDTGTDCVATALRHGCNSVTQFEILAKPPLTRAPDNPWPQWPRVYSLDYGQEEAMFVYGDDPRSYSVMSKEFIGDDGQVSGIRTVQIGWYANGNGRPHMEELPGTDKVWPAQLVLLAMGFLGPEQSLLDQLDVERDARSNAWAEYGKFATNVEGIFAAGDARRGQSLVVWAINEGRGAAREVDRWLMGETNLP
ncbi:MAG: glutamate synthase subunit beta [Candidatus Promineifilaceae bacterium]|nr:glutamate synthase subunit beta [Candidatus Promineifilaceae bacterium]